MNGIFSTEHIVKTVAALQLFRTCRTYAYYYCSVMLEWISCQFQNQYVHSDVWPSLDSSLFLWPFLPFPRSRYFIFRSVEKKERCSVIILAIWFQIESFVSFPLHTKTADLESISHCNRNKKPWSASSRPARPSLFHVCSFSQAESVSSRRHRTISFRPLTKLAAFRV